MTMTDPQVEAAIEAARETVQTLSILEAYLTAAQINEISVARALLALSAERERMAEALRAMVNRWEPGADGFADRRMWDNACDALSGTAPMDGWRPISEARQDGTQYLGFADDHFSDGYYAVIQWASEKDGYPAGWFWPFATRPTHFQPLPSAPMEKGE